MKQVIIGSAAVIVAIVVGCSQLESINNIGKLLTISEKVQPANPDCGATYLLREKFNLTASNKPGWTGRSIVYIFSKVDDKTREFVRCLVKGNFTPPRLDTKSDLYVMAVIGLNKEGIIYYLSKKDDMFTARTVAKIEDRDLYEVEDYMYTGLTAIIERFESGSVYLPTKSQRKTDYFSGRGITALYNSIAPNDFDNLLKKVETTDEK